MAMELPEIHSLGRSVFDPIWAEREHVDPWAELLHVLRGRVTVTTPTYRISGGPGETIYTPAGMPHRDVFPAGSVFEVYLVQFSWSAEEQVLGRFEPAALALGRGPAASWAADQCHRLYEEFSAGLPWHEATAATKLLEILLRMCQEAELSSGGASRRGQAERSSRGGRRQAIMEKAKRLMRENYAQPLSLSWLAEQLNVSPYYLSRVFSQDSGFCLSDYLTDLRMNEARMLLADGRLKIGQVAHAVGYRDAHYFGRVFRARMGRSPAVYRREVLGAGKKG
ncbi:MAG: helix-turn-helix domain-containing protein [Phycisphaeraceae bacterium]|nr:helix-turn-helix domain-containing protein [Phycisphaeraceae bacterium]